MITLQEYKAERCLSNGTLSNDGTYMKFTMKYTSNKSTASYVIKIGEVDSSTYNQFAQGNSTNYNDSYVNLNVTIDQGKAYNVIVELTDSDGTIIERTFIPRTFVLLDFNSSGAGLAIGKISSKNALEVNMDIYDQTGQVIRNGMAYYQAGGTADPDTTTEHLILTSTNTPASGFYYIMTVFYSSRNSNRSQMAIPYNQKTGIFHRTYFNGTWSDWIEEPIITEYKSEGIWTWKKFSDGTAECLARINLSGIAVTSALGGWYRSEVLYGETEYPYPVTFVEAPVTEMMFQSRNGSGAMVWPFSQSQSDVIPYLPQCYLIRPTTASYCAGIINILAKGKIS